MCILLHFSHFLSFPCHIFFKLMYPSSLSLLPKWPKVFWWLYISIRLLFPSALSAYFKITLHCFIISYLSFCFEVYLHVEVIFTIFFDSTRNWLITLLGSTTKYVLPPKKCLDFSFFYSMSFFPLQYIHRSPVQFPVSFCIEWEEFLLKQIFKE